MDRRCIATNTNGEPCQAQPVRPSGFCWFHDPTIAEERDRKRREGGKNRSNQARAKKGLPTEPMTPVELQVYLTVAFKAVLAGKLAPNVGNCLGTLARSMVQVREASELEERLAALEARAGLHRTG